VQLKRPVQLAIFVHPDERWQPIPVGKAEAQNLDVAFSK